MTRGTVIVVGRKTRESEIFVSRLEREHFEVVSVVNERKFWNLLKKHPVQAILFTASVPRSMVQRIEQVLHANKKTKFLPLILLAEDTVPEHLAGIKGVGETFRLHVIPLLEGLQRLRLAIQLSQIFR